MLDLFHVVVPLVLSMLHNYSSLIGCVNLACLRRLFLIEMSNLLPISGNNYVNTCSVE